MQSKLSVYENAVQIGEFYDLDDAVIYQLVFVCSIVLCWEHWQYRMKTIFNKG